MEGAGQVNRLYIEGLQPDKLAALRDVIARSTPELLPEVDAKLRRHRLPVPARHFEKSPVQAIMSAGAKNPPNFETVPRPKSLRPKSPDDVQAAILRYRRAFQGDDLALFYRNARAIIDTWQPGNVALLDWLNNWAARDGLGHIDALPNAPREAAATAIPIDPELARLAIALKFDTALRLWCVLRVYANGRGWIATRDLAGALRRFNVDLDRGTRQKAVAAGEGIFWHRNAKLKRLRLIGYQKLALALVEMAMRIAPDAAATNRPGQQPVFIDVAGDALDFKAGCYAAWHGERRQGISRFTLTRLWQASVPTLLAWEERAGIARQEAVAQYAGADPDLPPEHAYEYTTADGQRRKAWRASNHYIAPAFVEKQTGRRRVHRVRALCWGIVERSSEAIQDHAACGACGAAGGDTGTGWHLQRTGRRFFVSSKGVPDGRKRAIKHCQKHGDWQQPHYIRLATKRLKRGDMLIYDALAADAQTDAHELFTLRFPRRQSIKKYA